MICDLYVDRTFHWCHDFMQYQGKIPYTSPWVGFIHHTEDVEYSDYNTQKLVNNRNFQISLLMCKALFVFSCKLAKWLQKKIYKLGYKTQVLELSHPMEEPREKFTMSKYSKNPAKHLTHIGSWLRHPFSIYHVKSNGSLYKALLRGPNMETFCPPRSLTILPMKDITSISDLVSYGPVGPCRPETSKWVSGMINYLLDLRLISEAKYDNQTNTLFVRSDDIQKVTDIIEDCINSVKIIDRLSNDDYDDFLTKNVVFMHLVDAAAVNTVIECILRNTPVVVNRIEGVMEMLGKDYPLYYDKLEEVSGLLYLDKLSAAHEHLKRLDKDKYHFNHFIHRVGEVVNQL